MWLLGIEANCLYSAMFLNYTVIRYNEINPHFGAFQDFIAA